MKRALFAFVALLMMFGLTACQTATPTQAPTLAPTQAQATVTPTTEPTAAANKVVVKFWTDYTGDTFKQYFSAFSNPNIDLQVIYFEAQDYKTQSRLALSSGEKPDIWTTNTGTAVDQFIQGGGCMDLTDIAAQRGWTSRFSGAALNLGERDGKIYAIPFGGYYFWQVLYANKDFFQKNNIPYPKTVDDMIAIAPKIRAAGMQPIAWGNKDGWPAQIMLGDFMAQLAGADYSDKLNKGTVTWDNSPELTKALTAMQKLAKGGAFTAGFETQTQDASGPQAWVAQKAALLYNGTWFYGGVKDQIKFNVETIPLPLVDSSAQVQSTQSYPDPSIFINADTKVKDAAVEVFDYLISPDFYKVLATTNSCLTPCPAANGDLQVPDWLQSPLLTDQIKLPQFNFYTTVFPTPVEEALSDNLKQLLAGSITPDKAQKTIEAEAKGNR